MARSLPDEDLASLLGIDAVLHGLLLTDGLPSDVTGRLIRRLSEHGPLPPGATESDLSLLLHDLATRVHWAMGDGDEYPAASPHRMTYLLDLPDESAAEACGAELTAMGALSVSTTGPGLGAHPACLPQRGSRLPIRVTQFTRSIHLVMNI